MKESLPKNSGAQDSNRGGLRWLGLLFVGALLVVLIGILLPRSDKGTAHRQATNATKTAPPQNSDRSLWKASIERFRLHRNSATAPTAGEFVTNQFSLLVRNRRQILHNMAKAWNLQVPADFDKFFDVAEAGQWDELRGLFGTIMTNRQNGVWSEAASRLWPAVMETYGAAEAAHDWPAQQLLNYGDAVLGTLHPGEVYAGGTDAGRFIPTLMNETADGPQNIVLTQNALADGSYLDYVGFVYGDRLNTLTHDDSQKAFETYLADAKKRFEHDRDFPNEPKQLKPGEDIRMTDGRVQVSGQVAVMAINEKLFQTLMDKNPDTSFAIEQSFPFKSTYADATPVGPIMELRVTDQQNMLTTDRASQSVDYWNTTSQQLLSDPAYTDSPVIGHTYSKMAAEQASLLLDRNYPGEAEQLFQLATQLSPDSPEVTFRYVSLLMGQNRVADAISVADTAMKADPGNAQFRQLLDALTKAKH
jgi:Tetratricopeptide repeat